MEEILNFLQNEPSINAIIRLSHKKRLKVYLVGGFLRDRIIFKEKLDYDLDFAVSNCAFAFAKSLAKKLKANFVPLDEEHGCARLIYKRNSLPLILDFSDFRAAARSIRKDLSHRDFTINTIAIDLSDLKGANKLEDILIDNYSALKDLNSHIIKMVSKKSFLEDPLRIIRAFSLGAILDFTISQETLKQIKIDKEKLPEVSTERIREELFKILDSPRAYTYLKLMDKLGVLEEVIPQIEVMRNIKQGPYHHLDVWRHSLETLIQLENLINTIEDKRTQGYLNEKIASGHSRRALVKLAALLHDIGKPQAKKKKEGKTIFHGHERIGRDISKEISDMLKLSTKEKFALERMIFSHLRPGYLAESQVPTQRAIFRFFRDAQEETVAILLISLADQRATRGPLTVKCDRKHHEKVVMDLINYYFKKKEEKPFVRIINGNDLIKKLKLTPGPIFTKILRQVEEAQVVGKIQTKEEALVLAKKIAK